MHYQNSADLARVESNFLLALYRKIIGLVLLM